MSGLILDREQTVRLIQLYGAHRHLWDVGDARYFHRGRRDAAWRAIAADMQAPVPDLKKKLESLMGSYRREKSREKQSLLAGLGPDEAYKSKWYGYEHFHFMTEKTSPSSAQHVAAHAPFEAADGIKEELEEYEGEGEGADELTEQEAEFCAAMDAAPLSPAPAPPRLRARRRRRRTTASRSPPAPASPLDPYRAFGEYVASELRKYDASTLAHVKHAISGVLFDADLGRLPAPFRPVNNSHENPLENY